MNNHKLLYKCVEKDKVRKAFKNLDPHLINDVWIFIYFQY